MKIEEYLKSHKLLADGSIGTYYAKICQTDDTPEFANILHPERIREIHTEYIKAGAKLIRTNTFAANTSYLMRDMQAVKRNICAAVTIAQKAVKDCGKTEDDVYIAGSIGPIPVEESTYISLEEEYYEIAKTFLESGVRILDFETFADIDDIMPVIHKIKKEYDACIIVSFAVNQFGYSNAGLSARKLINAAAGSSDIDITGLNCGVGPGHMEQILSDIMLPDDKYILVMPNAGYPKRIRNRIEFSDSPEYFSDKMKQLDVLGADVYGGCCGTSPAFISRLAECIDWSAEKTTRKNKKQKPENKKPLKKGFLYNEDGSIKTHKLIAVELAPPFNADDKRLLSAAYELKDSGVDVLTFPDSPSGRTRVDSVLMAEKVRRETGMDVMPHICCRDKNAIAMRSTFLGAHINDIHNLLIITGDPVPTMARESIKSVFNFNSVGLMNIVKDMNEEIFKETPISYGGAVNQGRRNLDIEISRLKKKMEAGAEFFLSQPVFSKEDAERLKSIKEQTGARILCGIMPLVSRNNALFMKNEIAGVAVSDEVIDRYPENGTREEGEAVGVALAKEMIECTYDFADGYYFTFPFNRVYLMKQIWNGEDGKK